MITAHRLNPQENRNRSSASLTMRPTVLLTLVTAATVSCTSSTDPCTYSDGSPCEGISFWTWVCCTDGLYRTCGPGSIDTTGTEISTEGCNYYYYLLLLLLIHITLADRYYRCEPHYACLRYISVPAFLSLLALPAFVHSSTHLTCVIL